MRSSPAARGVARSFVVTLVHAFALGTRVAPVGAELRLNEVLYDPAGADDGLEFVELWNPDSVALGLGGLVLEAADGARSETWAVVWRGLAGDSVPPRRAYLISAASLSASLQNGPDAIRLVRNGTPLDRLGYGDVEWPGAYEGTPASDAPSGQSLARLPDGADSDVNRDDWRAVFPPTPGEPNLPDVRLRLSHAGATISPEVAWPGERVEVAAWVQNSGRLPLEADAWIAELDWSSGAAPDTGGGTWIPATMGVGVSIAPVDSARVSLSMVAPPAGAYRARLVLRGAPAGEALAAAAAIADTTMILARVLAGPAVLSEIAYRDAGGGEWIELWFREPVPDLADLSLADAAAAFRPIDRGPVPRGVEAGSFLVVAQDPPRARAFHSLPERMVVGLAGSWPSLNDAGEPGRPADRARLRGAGGIPCDAADYDPSIVSRGGSVERLSVDLPSADRGTWTESVDPGGATPGRPNSLRAPGDPESGAAARSEALLVAGARVLRHRSGLSVPVVFRATGACRGRRLTVRVQDLLGRPLRTLVEGQRLVADAAFVWDGRDDQGGPVRPGLYVVRAEALPEDGAPARASTLPVAVAAERTP